MAQSTRPRPDQATRDAVTERIFAHARQNWPRVEVLVRHSGAFCYVAVLEPARTRRRRLFTTKPDEREPFPVLRLRYQGSADRWLIAIYKASSQSWSESELPTRFGPPSAPPNRAWTTPSASGSAHPSADQQPSPSVTRSPSGDHENGETSDATATPARGSSGAPSCE